MSSLPQMPSGMLSGMPALKPAQPDEPPGRAIDDPALVRRAIFDKALLTVQELPPVTSSTHTLRLRNAAYEGPDNVGMREYKRALLSGDTLARRLRADVELVDNVSGNVLDARRTTLAAIPYYTDAGVFINKGTKYAMANQQRLRAGAYTRTRDNGEVETHINVPPGQGAPFRVFLDPATGVFKARVGQAQIPLVPMLQSLGVTEQDMRGAWGARLATANIAKVRGGDLNKLYTRLVRSGKSQTEPEQLAEIRQLLENTRLDPDVTRHTLNKPIERVDADALLTTTRKLLAIHNRKNPEMLKELGLEPADQDDRDHLAFMRLLGPEDITAERLRTAPKVLRPLLWKAGRTGKLDHMAPGALTRLVQDAILGSGLGQATEDINPLQVFEQQLRVTRMGVGGIPSDDSVPDSSRSVQPSHAGYIDPIVTPESGRAGIDVRLARLTRKGNDGELYSKFRDMRTGTDAWKQPKELFDSVIAFSTARPASPERPFNTADYVKFRNALDRGEIVRSESGKYFAQGMQRGQLDYYPIEQVDYAIPHMEDAFSPTANLVPGKSGMKGQRVAMGARMLTQALPLVDAEAPLVQSGVPGSSGSFEGLYGERMGALKAQQGGRVLGVSEDSITVQYDDGRKDEIELARHVPGARKTYTHQDPVVTPGARFEPGQLLARSNFTDKNGTAALGRNLRTAWMPLKGYNYEDAVVLSESGAKKLTSQHMYKTSVDIDKDTDKIGLAPYRGMFPKRFNAAQLEKVDEHGVVRVGQRVESGDPLVLMANERRGRVGEVSRAGSSRWRDAAETWEHEQPGIITDVAKTKNGVVVAVKSIVPMQVGDKLSNRYGSKGVVAAILPDDEMPTNEAGEPIELAVNDLGITTRTNPVQVIEAVLGKIALKRGEPYHLHDFNDIADLRAFAMKEAERYGVKGAEDLLDPETGKAIPRVMTGQHFIMKLHHVAESKVSGRSFGAYTADGTPAKGGPEGAKTWGMLHLNALLSHGAVDVAKDGHMVRGQRNPQYWAAVMAGKTPPDPPVPPVYRKFIAQLQASGIHPVREGTRTHLMAMTNSTIKELAGDREVTSPDTVDWNDDGMKPIRGGLFDESLFGGIDGERWAKISLPEPLPNPVMEEPIRRVLGLTGPQFERIIAGQEQLNGATGSRAIAAALSNINVDAEIERAAREIRGTRKTARDAATRRVGFLLGARKTGVKPSDWMWDSVPVMPPRWRPVSRMQGTDAPMVADANYLYRDLFENKRNFEQLQGQVSDVGDERLALYQSMRAVTGLGDPAPEHLKEQKIKGAMQHIIGCYDDKTEILTQAGWVRFPELPEGVPVATLNPTTAAFEWQLPTAYQRYRYCGELVRIQVGSRPRPKQQDVRVGTRIDLLLTPNHRNWVRRRLREYPDSELARGWGFEEAWQTAAFTGRSWWRTAAASWQGVDVLPDFLNCRFEAFAELVGWWIAEGWIHSDRKIVNLSQETARNRAKCDRIDALLKEVGLRHTRHDYVRKPDAYHTKSTAFAVWAIMSEDLVAWLVEHGGELAGNKRCSAAIKNWSTAGLEALLRGYLGGDGSARTIAAVTGIQRRTHKNRSRLTDVYHRVGTTSPRLFDDLQEIACKLGLTLRYSRDDNGVGNQAVLVVGQLGGQQLTQTEGKAGKSFEHYDGFVYCCTVPNGIVLVRRNGIPVFSGNSSPKFGVVQRRLLGSQTDLVGRGTIVPNPDLDMDQVGIPEDQAWQVYRPFLVRHMAKRGVAPGRAAEMVANRTDIARRALTDVMSERPILLDRAPVLHRFGVMAFWPRIAKGNQIELTPIVTKGFGADFDGDAMQFHVPGSDKAVTDAVEKMMPSSNLRAPADFKVHQLPQQEYLAGLYRATHDRKNAEPIPFPTTKAMLAALSRGEISHDQPVVIEE